ncbi:MAG: hypothetical protein ACM3SR_15865 [Ignavibacteriales bacterium]
MERYKIRIGWEGSHSLEEVINKMVDGGTNPDWDGNDYGLYQIYGRHILYGKNTLLYIGMVTEETFSQRFREHKIWLDYDQDEEDIKIYLSRIYDPKEHSERDNWESWKRDIVISEKILIYKYCHNYNLRELSYPPLLPFREVRLIHAGNRNRLKTKIMFQKTF